MVVAKIVGWNASVEVEPDDTACVARRSTLIGKRLGPLAFGFVALYWSLDRGCGAV